MCDVCCGDEALRKGGSVFKWDDKHQLAMQAKGTDAEARGKVRFRRKTDKTWSRWVDVHDVASSCGFFGVDVKWRFLSQRTQDFVNGKGSLESMAQRLELAMRQNATWRAEISTVYTLFQDDGCVYYTTSRQRRPGRGYVPADHADCVIELPTGECCTFMAPGSRAMLASGEKPMGYGLRTPVHTTDCDGALRLMVGLPEEGL